MAIAAIAIAIAAIFRYTLYLIPGSLLAVESRFDDIIKCEAFPDRDNHTDAQLQEEALR